ncbi:hypothetical protein OsI_22797 [Oryza sativa Indica Group]|uniref:Uncharacterized protein n=1 Tax=Oryza sativa subsp. indica TaxID=39946 RepID=A2YCG0_ORYSI|nr:hypothetical protein OsI_22797 [Oryza sativa Indica Group]
MVHPRGRPSKGRQAIGIRRIEDKPGGTSPSPRGGPGCSGRPRSSPSSPPLLRARPRVHDCEPEALRRAADEAKVEVARLRDVAGRQFLWWWEATNVEALGEAELPEFARALGRVRAAVVRRHAL